jgi:enoyl-[acyl-carrier-protein] reductase (NADH)
MARQGINIAMTLIHDAREEKHENIQENINSLTNLAITQCIGETDANLNAQITRYVDTITKNKLRNLGIDFTFGSLFFYL